MIKKASKRLSIAAVAIALAFGAANHMHKASDSYIRDRVVMLMSEQGRCSGIQVKAPSGKAYILTAAHCRVLVDKDNHITAVDEQGDKHQVDFIAEDDISDLMLLSAMSDKTIDVATDMGRHEKVHTMTHGRGHDSYRTDGETIEEAITMIAMSPITTQDELFACLKEPKNTIAAGIEGMFCALYTSQTYTTAIVVPGSSGGALLNSSGELVGIVSATDGTFSTFVRLLDIKSFLMRR